MATRIATKITREADKAAEAFKGLLLALRTRQPEAEKAKRFSDFAEAMKPFRSKPAR